MMEIGPQGGEGEGEEKGSRKTDRPSTYAYVPTVASKPRDGDENASNEGDEMQPGRRQT